MSILDELTTFLEDEGRLPCKSVDEVLTITWFDATANEITIAGTTKTCWRQVIHLTVEPFDYAGFNLIGAQIIMYKDGTCWLRDTYKYKMLTQIEQPKITKEPMKQSFKHAIGNFVYVLNNETASVSRMRVVELTERYNEPTQYVLSSFSGAKVHGIDPARIFAKPDAAFEAVTLDVTAKFSESDLQPGEALINGRKLHVTNRVLSRATIGHFIPGEGPRLHITYHYANKSTEHVLSEYGVIDVVKPVVVTARWMSK